MAEDVPLPHDETSQSQHSGEGREDDGCSSGARDPWGRSDPWSASRGRGRQQLDRRMEEEFLQFVQWRNLQNDAVNGGQRGNPPGGVAGGGLWQTYRDEHERTTLVTTGVQQGSKSQTRQAYEITICLDKEAH